MEGGGGGAGLVPGFSMGAGWRGGGGGMVPSERMLVESTRCWKVLWKLLMMRRQSLEQTARYIFNKIKRMFIMLRELTPSSLSLTYYTISNLVYI